MISPGMSCCEHTLNTLRYADRSVIRTTRHTLLGNYAQHCVHYRHTSLHTQHYSHTTPQHHRHYIHRYCVHYTHSTTDNTHHYRHYMDAGLQALHTYNTTDTHVTNHSVTLHVSLSTDCTQQCQQPRSRTMPSSYLKYSKIYCIEHIYEVVVHLIMLTNRGPSTICCDTLVLVWPLFQTLCVGLCSRDDCVFRVKELGPSGPADGKAPDILHSPIGGVLSPQNSDLAMLINANVSVTRSFYLQCCLRGLFICSNDMIKRYPVLP